MEKAISQDGTVIAFERSGAGPSLILVDGALCSRAFGPMPKLAKLLAPHFTVLMYDRRGRGDSGDTRPHAKEREVEDLAALIQAAGGSAFVLGLSSGAALALEAAAAGLPIRKLAAYEPPYMVDDGGHHARADHEGRLKALVGEGRRGAAVRYFMRDMVGVPRVVVGLMHLFPGVWPKLKAVAHTLPYDAAVMGDWSVPQARFASIAVPTMVIGGGKSEARLRRAVDAVAAVVPKAEKRTLEGQTHNVRAEVLVPVVVEHFRAEGGRS